MKARDVTESVPVESCAANLLEDTRLECVRKAEGREPPLYRRNLPDV